MKDVKLLQKKKILNFVLFIKKNLKKLNRIVRFKEIEKEKSNKSRQKQIERAKLRIRTIARIFVRELRRKLSISLDKYENDFKNFEKIVYQKKNSHNKIYSLSEPETECISRGKPRKKYEFGHKVSLAITKSTVIIIAIVLFIKNTFDGHTLSKTLEDVSKNTGKIPTVAYCDRGYRGVKEVNGTKIEIPDVPKKRTTPLEKKKARKNFGRRCSIEPVIGHLKHDFGMARNRLKGNRGDAINMFSAAMAFNLAKWMRLRPLYLIYCFFKTFLLFTPKFEPCKVYVGGK